MPDPVRIFDRRLLRLRRERALAHAGNHRFLHAHAAEAIAERLADVTAGFSRALLLGAGDELARAVAFAKAPAWMVAADPSAAVLMAQAQATCVAADEEWLPFAPASFDLVASLLALHWVNDLPGALVQIRQALVPDGLFLGTLLGGETLWELRRVLQQAEAETTGGAGSRVSPFADLRDMGSLMQRAGFALPVVDGERLVATYADLPALLHDLRGMGAGHAVARQAGEGFRRPLNRDTLMLADAIYRRDHGEEDGRLPATFHFIHLAGWSPSPTQRAPLRPGQAQFRLAEALGAEEFPAGDTVLMPQHPPSPRKDT